ncbi:hypothetical protein H2200_009407 [Cladophialophora chaetospira]|uniref:Uncharacterized protein n=1 Tax=Cladophialophora chaetospira TaxID=386627 RepID=A0AA39CFJ1_9EURO|nr:hypothetical protein H2200_009407 [Cladophialophora chaetospira]
MAEFQVTGTVTAIDQYLGSDFPKKWILQISAFHPKHGIVLAEPYEQFDGARFRDTPYVREYRARMLRSMRNGVRGFGLRFDGGVEAPEVIHNGLGRASISYRTEQGLAITISLRVSENGEVTQSAEITSFTNAVSRINFTLDFGISVNRASYGQLTEGGPIPIPRSENKISNTSDQQGLLITNTFLGAYLASYLESDGQSIDLQRAVQAKTFSSTLVVGSCSDSLDIPPRGTRTLTANFILRSGVAPNVHGDKGISQKVGLPKLWKNPEGVGRFIVRRNLEYILGNCAIPVPPSRQAVCLLTDHVALPLGWMRDNYFPEEGTLVEEILCSDTLSQIIDLIESRRDPRSGLYPTDETPGDDAVEFPFHFSSHVLLWHSLSRLVKLTASLMADSALERRLTALTEAVRTVTLEHFLWTGSATRKPSFAYLVDGSGQRTFYHDANDLPTLLAPLWGFTINDVEKQAWHNTMNFAFTPANQGGYYAGGAFEGLGSVHTRNPWTLGFFQQWRYAQITGDAQAEDVAWRKICGVMLWDGMFSEAVDGHTGEVTSKAWFSWPGSMIASGLLQPGNRARYL